MARLNERVTKLEDRRRFFRAYDDKNNRTPPADKSDWYQLASVDLGNGLNGGHGDSLPVVLPWGVVTRCTWGVVSW